MEKGSKTTDQLEFSASSSNFGYREENYESSDVALNNASGETAYLGNEGSNTYKLNEEMHKYNLNFCQYEDAPGSENLIQGDEEPRDRGIFHENNTQGYVNSVHLPKTTRVQKGYGFNRGCGSASESLPNNPSWNTNFSSSHLG